jgi:hypothetical protein
VQTTEDMAPPTRADEPQGPIALVAGVVAVPVFVVRHAHRHRAAHAHTVVRRLADVGRSEQASTTSRVRRVVASAQRKLYAKPAP